MAESNKEQNNEQVYFGVQKTETFYISDDKEQYIVHKKLNEGDRQNFEDQTGRQISFDRSSDEVRMDLSSGKERAVLFNLVMVSYKMKVREGDKNIIKEGSNVAEWEGLIKLMDGDLAQNFLEAIRSLNSWLKTEEKEIKAKQSKN